jgi:hypothetical protein
LQYLASISKISDDEIAEFFNELAAEDELGTTLPIGLLFYSERILKSKAAKRSLGPIWRRLTRRFGNEREIVQKLVK